MIGLFWLRLGRGHRCSRFEERLKFTSRLPAETGNGGYLFQCGRAEALHRTELFQQRRFALLTDSRELIEDTLGNLFEAKLRIVSVRKAVRFIPDTLQ